MKKQFEMFLISKDRFIKDAMKQMSDNGEKVLFVVDKNNVLFGALSDGDIRRWILNGKSLRDHVEKVCNRSPKVVGPEYDIEEVKRLMLQLKIEYVPVVDSKMNIVEVLAWDAVFREKIISQKTPITIQVVIMAGGQGTRLDPFTTVLPKPLIPIGEKPIIEIIMGKFNEYGIKDFYVSVNHKFRMIKSYFEEEDGKYNIRFVEEKIPLGTAGSLRLVKNKLKDPFIVTNCDIIIDTDYGEIVRFHKDSKYDMTLVVSCKHYVIPYGVCTIENGGRLKHLEEKPEHDLLVNTGMYVMTKGILDLIPKNQPFHMNELIESAKEHGFKIGAFPISEKAWIDIGQWDEYHKAVKHLRIN